MQIETAERLSQRLRSLADRVQSRMWLAVPYVGGWNAVKSVLGLQWRNSDEVRFRLLTDTTNTGWLDRRTIEEMNSHGKIKHLRGLHAKIYIVDDYALITSANLTEMAFSRRHEVGVFLSPKESKLVIQKFEEWWNKEAKFPADGWMKGLAKSPRQPSNEEPGESKPSKLYSLPSPPPDDQSISRQFHDYKAFLTAYREFADTYTAAGKRFFPQVPLYIETDMFLNYLYHDDGGPSKKYRQKKSPRNLTKQEQRAGISKQKKRFGAWIDDEENGASASIKGRIRGSSNVARLLAQRRIRKIGWVEVAIVAKTLHCMGRNRMRFLNPKNNRLKTIRDEWDFLLHRADVPIEARMSRCYERLVRFGQSAVQELPGWYNLQKYPIRNSNSNAGLRFLGY